MSLSIISTSIIEKTRTIRHTEQNEEEEEAKRK
jgi:hypothetical protein